MHRKAANKQILKVGVVVLAVIILVAILFAVGPREVRTGQSILPGGAVTINNLATCPPTSNLNLVLKVTGMLTVFSGAEIPATSVTFCCPRGGVCGITVPNPSCYTEGSTINLNLGSFICNSDGNWQKCDGTPGSQGVIKGFGNDARICIASQWRPLDCTSQAGISVGGRAYCDGQKWTQQCTVVNPTNILPDGTTATGRNILSGNLACCPEGYCGVDGACVAQGQRVGDPGVVPILSADANRHLCTQRSTWVACDSSLASVRGTIKDGFVCSRNNEWVPVTQGCNAANTGQSYGNAYCDGTRWQTCTGTNVYCPNSAD